MEECNKEPDETVPIKLLQWTGHFIVYFSIEMPWLSFENYQRTGVIGLSPGRHRDRAHPKMSRATFITIALLKARAYA